MTDRRLEVQRAIAADPDTIFEVLRSPDGHVAIDASGMLMSAEGEPVGAVAETGGQGLYMFAPIALPEFQLVVGPGAGISVLGSLLGILATIVVAIGAIIMWPLRKAMKKRKAAAAADTASETAADQASDQS